MLLVAFIPALCLATKVKLCSIRDHQLDSKFNLDSHPQLLAGVKQAMKDKDQASSMALRMYNLDKSSGSKIASRTIIGVLLNAVLRRTESAAQFVRYERPDLADKEAHEAEIISAYLPPMLSVAEIDKVLGEVAPSCPQNENTKKTLGLIVKAFYSKVDKANVDPDLVKSRAEALFSVQCLK